MDVNAQQCDGAMSDVMDVGNIVRKIESFGAKAIEVNAHDINELNNAKNTIHDGKPLIILAKSSPYQGMTFLKKRFPRLHYVRFKSPEERAEMNISIANELGIEPIKY